MTKDTDCSFFCSSRVFSSDNTDYEDREELFNMLGLLENRPESALESRINDVGLDMSFDLDSSYDEDEEPDEELSESLDLDYEDSDFNLNRKKNINYDELLEAMIEEGREGGFDKEDVEDYFSFVDDEDRWGWFKKKWNKATKKNSYQGKPASSSLCRAVYDRCHQNKWLNRVFYKKSIQQDCHTWNNTCKGYHHCYHGTSRRRSRERGTHYVMHWGGHGCWV